MFRSTPTPKSKSELTFGIIALSASSNPDTFNRALKYFEERGMKGVVMLDPTENYGKVTHLFSSDSIQARVGALHSLYEDSSIDAIISVRGAYGSMEVLPYLNFKLLHAHPKPLIGFSDTTTLLIALYQSAKINTIHGVGLEGAFSKAAKGDSEARTSIDELFKVLANPYHNPFKGMSFKVLRGGKGTGELIGGNLSLIASMMGTPWEIETRDRVLFLEDVAESPYRIHRMLLQMKLAGKLKQLQAVLLGSFSDCAHVNQHGPDLRETFDDIFYDADYPVLMDLPFGHQTLNLPLRLGTVVQVEDGTVNMVEK